MIEMTDEELKNTADGFNIGDPVKADAHMIRYCPGCSMLSAISHGTVVGKTRNEKNQHYFLNIKWIAAAMWRQVQILSASSIDLLGAAEQKSYPKQKLRTLAFECFCP